MDIKNAANQTEALQRVLESGVFNAAQVEVIDRLIAATKTGTERAVADYLRTMEESAVFWAANAQRFIQML
jgi:hypothetical protein